MAEVSADFTIDEVFDSGWQRFRGRFMAIILTILITYLLISGGGLAIFILIAIPAVLFVVTKWVIFIPLILLTVIAGVVLFIYLINWLTLAQISVITGEEKMDVMANIKDVRKKALNYLVFSSVYSLFLAGVFFFFLIPVFFWLIWGVFAGIVFLYEKQQGPLQPLWRSRELVKGNFLKIFLVMLIVFISSWLISWTFSLVKQLSLIGMVINLFVVSPLAISIYYSIFEKLKAGKPLQLRYKSNGWVAVSVVGYLFLIIFLAVIIMSGTNFLEGFDMSKFSPDSFMPIEAVDYPIPTFSYY